MLGSIGVICLGEDYTDLVPADCNLSRFLEGLECSLCLLTCLVASMPFVEILDTRSAKSN